MTGRMSVTFVARKGSPVIKAIKVSRAYRVSKVRRGFKDPSVQLVRRVLRDRKARRGRKVLLAL
jgi:hypothetical protein